MEKFKTFDWKKLEEFVEKNDPFEVSIGLKEGWANTSKTIYVSWDNPKWKDRINLVVTSTWATPSFVAYMKDGSEVQSECSRDTTPEEEERERELYEIHMKTLNEYIGKFSSIEQAEEAIREGIERIRDENLPRFLDESGIYNKFNQ